MSSPNVNPNMEYRRLGASGLRVSVLSFGSWVTFGNQLDTGLARDCIDAAGEAGCNFFDNAEVYAGGESETIMGRVFQELGWPRWSYVLTTKAFWGIHRDVPNMNNTLNRKYLMQSIDGSLERLQTDFVDVFYRDAHWPAFNVADMGISIGVTVLILLSLIGRDDGLFSGE